MATRIVITEHAIERYIARHREDLCQHDRRDRSAAHGALMQAMVTGCRLKERTFAGDAMWRSQDIDVLLVTKDDPGAIVVVTVLPPDAYLRSAGGRLRHISEEERELMAEAAARGPSLLDMVEAKDAGMTVLAWLAHKAAADVKGAA